MNDKDKIYLSCEENGDIYAMRLPDDLSSELENLSLGEKSSNPIDAMDSLIYSVYQAVDRLEDLKRKIRSGNFIYRYNSENISGINISHMVEHIREVERERLQTDIKIKKATHRLENSTDKSIIESFINKLYKEVLPIPNIIPIANNNATQFSWNIGKNRLVLNKPANNKNVWGNLYLGRSKHPVEVEFSNINDVISMLKLLSK